LISALIADEHGGEAPDDDARAEIIENLPTLLIGAWVYWRDWEAGGRKAGQPVRSVKTGRNDPCPCGSGRKFKKCCGAGSQSVH
ncbi:MAG: SEC-C metal-binding domain-containing protein, partial [Nevskia sp.]|uniref:SEC-C metal-binding domain-containing protein n=1 Tax=Nevskia sp. TaxID=1929292 RepID=UPI004035AF93